MERRFLCGWVSRRQREGRANMTKEEVVENKYAGCNIFLSFSSSHLFFPASSLAVLAPPPSDVWISHWLTHTAISLTLPHAAYSSTLEVEVACSCKTSGNLYQSTVLHPRTQHPSWWYFLLHFNSMWQVLNQKLLLKLTSVTQVLT